jgi:hypothetical protein
MERSELRELHYITRIENLSSIIKNGIVCNRKSQRLGAVSIALAEVQEKRSGKRVPEGLMLHEYVNLYVNARNPMLSCRRGMYGKICVLRVDCGVLDLAGVVITDRNAASKYARFAAAPGGLSIIDSERTFAEWWTHEDDQIAEWRHKSAMCAEVLVPERVAPAHINGAYVAGQEAEQMITGLRLAIDTTINGRLFFK